MDYIIVHWEGTTNFNCQDKGYNHATSMKFHESCNRVKKLMTQCTGLSANGYLRESLLIIKI
jgi:hypothetical protein